MYRGETAGRIEMPFGTGIHYQTVSDSSRKRPRIDEL